MLHHSLSVSKYDQDPKILKILSSAQPMEVDGPFLPPRDRETLWKNLCLIGKNNTECIVEFSRTSTKFFIVALDISQNCYHVIQLFRQQANKLLKVCDSDLERLMKMLSFKHNNMYIKHQDILMSFERFMP